MRFVYVVATLLLLLLGACKKSPTEPVDEQPEENRALLTDGAVRS